jgi:DNA-3-methyladenine glycosylase II
MLGTNVDLEPFYRAAARISWLDPLVTAARGLKPPRYPTMWETCVNAIVYQQISIHAAGAILRRLLERYAPPVVGEGETLRAFPGPDDVLHADLTELRALGMSASKIASVRAAAEAIVSGTLDEDTLQRRSTEELMTSLTRLQGVGPWTAAVIALRGFGRLDVFPMNDSGVARILKARAPEQTIDVDGVLAQLGEQRGMLYYHLLIDGMARRGSVEL